MSNLDSQNLDALRARLHKCSEHLQTILDGCVASLSDASNPLRFMNTATGLRELLRELFGSLSPDESIKECLWFKADSHPEKPVTRRHRILFAVYSYLNPEHFPKNFVLQLDELSRFTHVTKTTLETPAQIGVASFDLTLDLFLRLFDAIDSGREHLLDALQIELQERLAEIFTSDFFDELDMLSTHTRPQDADGIQVEIEDIDLETITFSGNGFVLCDLQYGSDGDCRRGDGLEWEDSFPFTFSGEALTSDPQQVTVDRGDISVDTSSYDE
jgi:Predicted pPIWI-associating nuclease